MSANAEGLVAVVPVRGLPAGKRRLAALLDADERNDLVRAMLDDVVAALVAAESVGSILIASRDVAARDEASRLGVGFLDQTDIRLGYNRASGICPGCVEGCGGDARCACRRAVDHA